MRKQQADMEDLLKNLKDDQPCPQCHRKAVAELSKQPSNDSKFNNKDTSLRLDSNEPNMIKSFDNVQFKRVNEEIEEDIETNADFTVDDLKI